ncbi:alpha/beta hydrolase [Streptomyces sp. INA 01156]
MAPALPSCGEADLPGGVGGPGLPEDVAAVRQVLQAGDEPTVVVAHSYGGVVTAEAAAESGRCATCCWSPATCPRSGRACRSSGRQPRPVPRRRPRHRHVRGPPELLVDTFLQDCDPEAQAQAADHLARQSVQVTGQPVGAAAWQQLPSTYLVCAQDRGTPPRLQREFARRAGSVVELDAGHHPFLSQPAAVRDLLLSL